MEPAIRPKRKVRFRLVPVIGYIVVAFAVAWVLDLQATTTIIIVKHADVDLGVPLDSDPPLNARGRQRAQQLADFLGDVDVVASVDAIYSTAARRTQETAEPLAKRLGLVQNIDDPYRVERQARRLLRDRRGKITLFVMDADAIQPLIDELHGSKRLSPIPPNDFGQVYIVTIPYYEKVKTLLLHYGDPPVEPKSLTDASSEAPPSP